MAGGWSSECRSADETQIRFVDMDAETLGAIKEQIKIVSEEREVWC